MKAPILSTYLGGFLLLSTAKWAQIGDSFVLYELKLFLQTSFRMAGNIKYGAYHKQHRVNKPQGSPDGPKRPPIKH